jgi:hypothetical protein
MNKPKNAPPDKPLLRNSARGRSIQRPHVFLCYFHEDIPHAERLRDQLVKNGHSVWWDKEILPGRTGVARSRPQCDAPTQ